MIFLDRKNNTSRRSRICVGALLAALALATVSTTLAAPEDDLSMRFSSEPVAGGPGNIVGAVTNRSNLRYPCVDAIFSLSTHFDDRQAGLPVVSYGNQSIRIRDIASGGTIRFSAPLLRKAGIRFFGYALCAAPVADDSPPPPPRDDLPDQRPPGDAPTPTPTPTPTPSPESAQTCDITGRIASDTDFHGFDDRNQRQVIERAYILDAADRSLVEEVQVGNAKTRVRDHRTGLDYVTRPFAVSGLPANQRYIARLSHAWRTDPDEIVFGCPNFRGRFSFELPMLRHTGNRLGG